MDLPRIRSFQRDLPKPTHQGISGFFSKLLPLAGGAFMLSQRVGRQYRPLQNIQPEKRFVWSNHAPQDNPPPSLFASRNKSPAKSLITIETSTSPDLDPAFDRFVKDRFQLDQFIAERFELDRFAPANEFSKTETAIATTSKKVEFSESTTHFYEVDPSTLFRKNGQPLKHVPNAQERSDLSRHKRALKLNPTAPTRVASDTTTIAPQQKAFIAFKKGVDNLLHQRSRAMTKSDLADVFGIRKSAVLAPEFPNNLQLGDIDKQVWQQDHAMFPRLLKMNSHKSMKSQAEWLALRLDIQQYGHDGALDQDESAKTKQNPQTPQQSQHIPEPTFFESALDSFIEILQSSFMKWFNFK